MISDWEFRRSFRRHVGRYLVRIGGIFGLGAVVFVGVWGLLEAFDRRDDALVRTEAALAVGVVAALVATGASARSADRDLRSDPHLVCPYCDNPLALYDGIIVLSSGNCPHCGERVLEG